MTHTNNIPVIVFDCGASTGIAVLDEDSNVLFTTTLLLQELEGFLEFLRIKIGNFDSDIDVVVEVGPEFGHHSPVTKRIELLILDTFPNAHRIKPSQWKSHPQSRKRIDLPRRMATIHEKDAAHLGTWFQLTGERNGKGPNAT